MNRALAGTVVYSSMPLLHISGPLVRQDCCPCEENDDSVLNVCCLYQRLFSGVCYVTGSLAFKYFQAMQLHVPYLTSSCYTGSMSVQKKNTTT